MVGVIDITTKYKELESKLIEDFKRNPTFRQALTNLSTIYLARLEILEAVDKRGIECEMPHMGRYYADIFRGAKNSLASFAREKNK